MSEKIIGKFGKIVLIVGLMLICLGFCACGSQKTTIKDIETIFPSQVDQLDPQLQPQVRKKGLQFFDSYHERGGPHLMIDSLNMVIPLTDADLRKMLTFATAALKSKEGRSDQSPEGARQVVKYYPANQTAKQMLGKEAPFAAVCNGAYFEGTFDPDGKLVSLQYFDKTIASEIVPAQLTATKATCWDLIFNRPAYYANEEGQPFPNRAQILRDSGRYVRFVDYLAENGEKIARGTFVYGVNDQIIEQRLEFNGEGDLTNLNSFLFDRQFSTVKPGWIAKGLYNNQKYLKKLVVMDDLGNRYYDYRFSYRITPEGMTVIRQVFDQAGQAAGKIELNYNQHGRLIKRIAYADNQRVSDYQTFAIDYEKMKLVVDFYGPDGVLIDRLYRSL